MRILTGNRKFLLAAFAVFLSVRAFADPMEDTSLTGMSLEDLMSIQVTSVSKKEQNLSDSAAAIFVITNRDIIHSGATSIPEILRMVPGLHVARINANNWAVSSRGFSSRWTEKLLVLIDGRSVYTPTFSGVYWEVQDVLLEDVERIEIIRGPGAALWGANAVNGVINIITKHTADTRGGLISVGAGNTEQAFGGVRYGASLGNGFYGRIYAKYFARDEFEYNSGGGDAGDDWDTFRTGFRLDKKLTGPDSLTLQGDVYTGNISGRYYDVPTEAPPYTVIVEEEAEVSGGNILTRWQRVLSSDSELTFQAYYDHTLRKDFFTHEKRDSFDLDFQHRFSPFDRHDTVWGLRYRYTHDDFSQPFIAEFDPQSRGDNLFSAFVQDEISFFKEKLLLTLGTKIEHNDYTGYEWQPNGRLLWSPLKAHRFWASVSRAVRTPSRLEHDGWLHTVNLIPPPSLQTPPVRISIVGDDLFDAEELTAYEAGYRLVVSPRLSFDFAFFFNDYDKLRTYEYLPIVPGDHLTDLGLITTNSSSGEVYGMEANALWKLSERLNIQAAYSYIHSDIDRVGWGVGEETPKHQFSLRAGFTPSDHWNIDFWMRYVDKKITNYADAGIYRQYEIDSYVTADLRAAWRLSEKWELIAVGQNLLNDGHLEFVQEVFTPPTEIPRSFYGQIKYNF